MYARAQCINCIVQYSIVQLSNHRLILALNVKPKHCPLAYLLPDPCGTLSFPSSSISSEFESFYRAKAGLYLAPEGHNLGFLQKKRAEIARRAAENMAHDATCSITANRS